MNARSCAFQVDGFKTSHPFNPNSSLSPSRSTGGEDTLRPSASANRDLPGAFGAPGLLGCGGAGGSAGPSVACRGGGGKSVCTPAIDLVDDEYTESGLPFRTCFGPVGDGPVPEADKCTGFFATGGGVFFDKEVCEEALLRRLAGRDGEDWLAETSLVILLTLTLLGIELVGSNGGGSFRGVGIRPLGSVAVDATDEAID